MNRLLLSCSILALAAALSAGTSAQGDPHRPPLSRKATSLFTSSDNCIACHNGLRTTSGDDVSIGTAWRSTMMANSARDPYFQAGLRRETMEHPTRAAEIEHECAGCHAPMLQRAAHTDKRETDLLHQLAVPDPDGAGHRLAIDGVSCAVCHQISGERLGTRETANGRFLMAPVGSPREAFGPFGVNAGRARIMSSVTGFAQTEAPHVQQSAICATCHTLYTEALDGTGKVIGELPEQMTYAEWEHSAFYTEKRSCQSCHMPEVQERTRVASVLGEEREGLSRHVFVGGNFLVLRMLDRLRKELRVEASSVELETTARATLQQLASESATVTLAGRRTGTHVTAEVTVRNLAGHKFPSGYPSRRTWIHLTARDAAGQVVFESGGLRADGAIAGNDNDAAAAAFEPHHDRIENSDQVQIYESIMSDTEGRATTGLLHAIRYLKDNRLLPRGFSKGLAAPDIAVHGAAQSDANFMGGEDTVSYVLPSSAVSVHVELRYQPIAFRWAQNLRAFDALEPQRFLRAFTDMAQDSSAVVSHATAQVP
jgi:hypothetical protein